MSDELCVQIIPEGMTKKRVNCAWGKQQNSLDPHSFKYIFDIAKQKKEPK